MLTCMVPPMLLVAAPKRAGQEFGTVTRVACYATMALAAALEAAATNCNGRPPFGEVWVQCTVYTHI